VLEDEPRILEQELKEPLAHNGPFYVVR
jgi:hypothetical protein